jgi:hypothetical protein
MTTINQIKREAYNLGIRYVTTKNPVELLRLIKEAKQSPNKPNSPDVINSNTINQYPRESTQSIPILSPRQKPQSLPRITSNRRASSQQASSKGSQQASSQPKSVTKKRSGERDNSTRSSPPKDRRSSSSSSSSSSRPSPSSPAPRFSKLEKAKLLLMALTIKMKFPLDISKRENDFERIDVHIKKNYNNKYETIQNDVRSLEDVKVALSKIKNEYNSLVKIIHSPVKNTPEAKKEMDAKKRVILLMLLTKQKIPEKMAKSAYVNARDIAQQDYPSIYAKVNSYSESEVSDLVSKELNNKLLLIKTVYSLITENNKRPYKKRDPKSRGKYNVD